MVQIWMPACRFSFQPQQGPERLPEILEAIEDRMRHKLVLLTKDNGTDMQLSDLVYLKHAENIQRRSVPTRGPRTCSVCSEKALGEPYSIWRSGTARRAIAQWGKALYSFSQTQSRKSATVLLRLVSEVPSFACGRVHVQTPLRSPRRPAGIWRRRKWSSEG